MVASSSMTMDIDLDTVPAHALNVSSRMKLSWFLNPEHTLCSTQGIPRDYRGLAQQMGFQYNDIKNFQRNEDPTSKILDAWSSVSDNTIGLLMSYLENMDRYDAIEDLINQFRKDAESYMERHRKISESPIQVAEVTPGPPCAFRPESPNALTVTDVERGGPSYYDAYVCYAEEDTDFVQRLATYLEDRGLVLFIKGRDLLAGTSELEAHTQLLEERCKFVLIILSPAFLTSPECEWQISFAAGLAIEYRKRKLIPVVTTPCEIPSVLKYVSKIDFTKPAQEWLLDKLVQSLRPNNCSLFIPSTQASLPAPRRQQELCLQNATNPMITFPPSTTHSQNLCVYESSSLEIAPISNSFNVASTSSEATALITTKTPPQVKQKWYRNIKEKFSLNSSSSGTQPSTTSTATSGFHSYSGFVSESSSDSKKRDDFSDSKKRDDFSDSKKRDDFSDSKKRDDFSDSKKRDDFSEDTV